MAMTMDTIIVTIGKIGVLVAVLMLLTVSGASVSVTEALRRDTAAVNRAGKTKEEDLETLILLYHVWTAAPVSTWT